jgi:hypothetical protein
MPLTIEIPKYIGACPGCGNSLTINGKINPLSKNVIVCNKCQQEFIIAFTIQLYTLQGLKSNYRAMLEIVALERDIEADLEADQEPVEKNLIGGKTE